MTTISAKAILVSRNIEDPDPHRKLSTLLLRYPRWIHAEARTHRVLRIGEEPTPSLMEAPELSRNASSSRAIPVKKMIDDVLDDPAIPMFWGANQRGMQAGGECDALVPVTRTRAPFSDDYDVKKIDRESAWLEARDDAIKWASRFAEAGYAKQIVNRLLEPFSHITVVVTASEWTNFFALRDHGAAEPHIRLLANLMRHAMDTAFVVSRAPGTWHLPFLSKEEDDNLGVVEKKKLSVARCASTSYKTVDGFDMTLERAVDLYDKLISNVPMHASPLEHQAQADGFDGGAWHNRTQHRNLVGWRQLRAMVE